MASRTPGPIWPADYHADPDGGALVQILPGVWIHWNTPGRDRPDPPDVHGLWAGFIGRGRDTNPYNPEPGQGKTGHDAWDQAWIQGRDARRAMQTAPAPVDPYAGGLEQEG